MSKYESLGDNLKKQDESREWPNRRREKEKIDFLDKVQFVKLRTTWNIWRYFPISSCKFEIFPLILVSTKSLYVKSARIRMRSFERQ